MPALFQRLTFQWSGAFRALAGHLGRATSWMLVAAILLTQTAQGQTLSAQEAARLDRIDAFIEVMGFDVMLESMVISARRAPSMLGIDEKDFGLAWVAQVDQIFAPKKLNSQARTILAETLSDDALDHAASFYASSFGQKLVQAENAAHMESGPKSIDAGQRIVAALVESNSPRLAYFSRLMLATGLEETAVRSVIELRVRFLTAAADAGVIDLKIRPDQLRARLMQQQTRLRTAIKLQTLASSAYAYRDFTDDEILAYAKELETPQMRGVYELLNAIQYELAAERYEEIARRLADLQPAQEL